jgi:hypothetical protein
MRRFVPRAPRAERIFALWDALCAPQRAKLSQRRTSKKQKVLQRSNPFVSETFVPFGLLAGVPALETDVNLATAEAKDSLIHPATSQGGVAGWRDEIGLNAGQKTAWG